MLDLIGDNAARVTRRRLFGSAGQGIGAAALATILQRESAGATHGNPGLPG